MQQKPSSQKGRSFQHPPLLRECRSNSCPVCQDPSLWEILISNHESCLLAMIHIWSAKSCLVRLYEGSIGQTCQTRNNSLHKVPVLMTADVLTIMARRKADTECYPDVRTTMCLTRIECANTGRTLVELDRVGGDHAPAKLPCIRPTVPSRPNQQNQKQKLIYLVQRKST